MSKGHVSAGQLADNIDKTSKIWAKTQAQTWASEPRLFIFLCYAVVTLLMAAPFVQNFLFSSQMSLSNFRDIDDWAFQLVLRKVHVMLHEGRFYDIWSINDYAYGWIYWFSMSILTYPCYLLSTYAQVDWPLLSTPRQISLVFALLSLIFMRKILKRARVPEQGIAVTLLIFSLYPSLGYFSMRFGTVNAVTFFSLLSFYFAQKSDLVTLKDRTLPFASLAIAAGIKLSGLLIAPLIIAMVLYRLRARSIFGIVRALTLPALISVLLLVTLTNPAFLTMPWNAKVGVDYWNTLSFFLKSAKSAADMSNPFMRFYNGVFTTPLNAISIGILTLGLGIWWKKRREHRFDIAAIVLSLSLVTAYVMASIQNATGTGSYITAVSFLLLLGTVGWVQTRLGVQLLVTVAVLLMADTSFRALAQYKAGKTETNEWNHFAYFNKYRGMSKTFENAQFMEECLDVVSDKKWGGHIFSDYRLSLPFNAITHPNACFSIAWDNLSADLKYCDRPLDILILDKDAPAELPHEEFDAFLRKAGPKTIDGLKLDRASRIELKSHGRFNSQDFILACENDRVRIFKLKSTLQN